MEPLITHKGKVALLNRANIDTDQIIPKQFLKQIGRTGFGKYLFYDWRYLDNGNDNPRFELNNPKYKGATILLTGDNFGCGSSREHAPWALMEYGFKIIISTSFADIFYSNCIKNGILPITVSFEHHKNLVAEFNDVKEINFRVDLPTQTLISHINKKILFEIDAFRKKALIKGMDDIAWTLQFDKLIHSFEKQQAVSAPWLWR